MLTAIALTIGLCGQPGPKPVDGPKAVITDDAGKPFPASVEGVRVLYFHADKASRDPGNEVFWQVWPKTYQKNAKKFPAGVGLMFVVPVADDSVTLEVQQIVAKTVGKDAQSNLATIMVKVNGGPRPPPVPPEPKPPDPKPPEPVIKGFRVVVIRESGDAVSKSKTVAMFAGSIRKYLNEKCVKADNGHPEWRIYDDEQTFAESESYAMRELFQKALPTLKSLPAIVIASDGKFVAYPLPETEAETLALLKSKGG